MSSTVEVWGMFTVFEIAPEMKGWTARHHLDVAHVGDGALADGHVEDRQVLAARPARRRSSVLVDVGLDLLDLLGRVAQRVQRHRHLRLTIVICPPPTSSLYLTSEKSGSTPVVSQSIRNEIVPVGAITSPERCGSRGPRLGPRPGPRTCARPGEQRERPWTAASGIA